MRLKESRGLLVFYFFDEVKESRGLLVFFDEVEKMTEAPGVLFVKVVRIS